MKAVVLAGGYATRLWPITETRPKMFLPVGENTVIDEIFEDFEADDRIDEVFVSTNERFADAFADYLTDSPFKKPTLSVEETVEEDEKFGVVGALAQLVERENVDDDLIVVAGDNMISFDLSDFADFFESKGTPTLAAYDVGDRERAKSYGLVDLDGDEVIDFQEKPDDPKTTLVSIACYAFPAETLPDLSTYLEDGNKPRRAGVVPPVAPEARRGPRVHLRRRVVRHRHRRQLPRRGGVRARRWNARCRRRDRRELRSRRRGPRHVGRHRHRLDARTRRRLPERNDH